MRIPLLKRARIVQSTGSDRSAAQQPPTPTIHRRVHALRRPVMPLDPVPYAIAFVLGLIAIPVLLRIATAFGLYAVVREREAQVFTLFGKVIGTLDEPGLRFPLATSAPRPCCCRSSASARGQHGMLRQRYLRDQMVNSEEGTPMGVGIWYEMQVSDPVAYLFNNADPEGSLQANVASATISTLSNLEMDKLLEDRHQLSRKVRATVSPLSEKWGYPARLGLHPQGRLHRPRDGRQHHRQGGQAPGAGHQRHEAGRREPRRPDQEPDRLQGLREDGRGGGHAPVGGRRDPERDRRRRTPRCSTPCCR
jgi:hypothetical protein